MIEPVNIGEAVLYNADCREALALLADNSVDSIVTDPPYELGFMGKSWDASGIANNVEMWTEALRVLKPGGHLLAFGGSRTYHRMTCAIEDAGFEIRDQIMWIYGSGFPKSHNGEWGGTALKPAHEPICVARKPLIGTVEANWTAHGTGALNIDGCRVGDFQNTTPSGVDRRNAKLAELGYRPGAYQMGDKEPDTPPGRWPANVIHDGSDEVIALFPDTESGKPSGIKAGNNNNVFGQYAGGIPVTRYGDSGSAARFFYCPKADREDRNEGVQHFDAKPMNWSSGEKSPGTFQSPNTNPSSPNNHPTVKPTELMRYLCRLVTPINGTVLDLFMGSGSTGKAAWIEGFKFIGVEKEPEYFEIAKARVRSVPVQEGMFA